MRDHPVQVNGPLAPYRHNPEPEVHNPEVVKLLEGVLEQVKRGEVISVAVACEFTERCYSTGWWVGKGGNSITLLGAVKVLGVRMVRWLDGGED